jgi:N-acetylglutamate synthase-like GNAT family acetyltransferase
MNIRPVEEADIESIIQLFRANYGDDYFLPEFYDPQWVKRGIYSDHIIWVVAEEDGVVLGSAALMLNAGDYNDQIGEIGRLVVNPNAGGRGLGGVLMNALVDASDDRVEFTFAEARTVHPKTQKICDRLGLAALAYLPLYYQMTWRESWILSGQLFGNGRTLRHAGSARVIPSVVPLARLSLKNLELDEPVTEVADTSTWATRSSAPARPITSSSTRATTPWARSAFSSTSATSRCASLS